MDANGNTDLVKKEKVRQQILVVDDSEMNREILSDMLGNDFRILEAENGEECLQLLDQYGTGISAILLVQAIRDFKLDMSRFEKVLLHLST